MSKEDNNSHLHIIQQFTYNTTNLLKINQSSDNSTYPEECYYLKHDWLGEKLILMSIVGTAIAMLGILGNMTTALILTRPSMRSPNNLYLTALAVFDTCLLVTAILIYSLEYIIEYTNNFELYVAWLTYLRFCYALSHIAQTGSVYTTVAVTIERYLAVVHPIRGRSICNKRGAGVTIICVTVFAILFNSTKFFELEIRRQENCNEFKAYSLGTGPLVTMNYHLIYSLWLSNVVMVFFPFLLLLLFNSVIAWTIRKSLNRLAWANTRHDRRNELKEKSRDATRVLVVIVLIFLICNLWGFVITLLESIIGGQKLSMQYKKFYTFSRESVNFLAIVNSSINFVIYILFGKDFRKELITVYGCRVSIPMFLPPEDKFTALENLRARLQVKSPTRRGGIKKRKSNVQQLCSKSVQVFEALNMNIDTNEQFNDSDGSSSDMEINPNIYGRPDYIPHSMRKPDSNKPEATGLLGVPTKLRRASSTFSKCSNHSSWNSNNLPLIISNGEVGKVRVNQSSPNGGAKMQSTIDGASWKKSGESVNLYVPSIKHTDYDKITQRQFDQGVIFSLSSQKLNVPQVQLMLLNEQSVESRLSAETNSSSEDATIWL